MRKPNTFCSQCNTPLYRKPCDKAKTNNSFCSRECQKTFNNKGFPQSVCAFCGTAFSDSSYKKTRKFCSHSCSNKHRRGIRYTGQRTHNRSKENLTLLMRLFNFDSCMVVGCDYSRVYHIHRLKEGRAGGEYIVGNMFAICPNHHAEYHAGLVDFIKVNDYTLSAMERSTSAA